MAGNRGASRGLTLVELLVVIALVAILAGITMPVIFRAKRNAKTSACVSNMRQAVMAVQMYRQDWGGSPPVSLLTWSFEGTALFVGADHYAKGPEIFHCPLNGQLYHYRFHLHTMDSDLLKAHDRWARAIIEDEEPPGALIKCFNHRRGQDVDRGEFQVLGASLDGSVGWVTFLDPALKDFFVSEMGGKKR
jgi:prepilin-type N-terminal cleavage/methylation domain-containing protein